MADDWKPGGIDTSVAHPARMYDYFLSGKDNFQADRTAADQAILRMPQVVAAAQANRRFLRRAVDHVARLGVRQFLDLGTGIPTSPNTHEVAQAVDPSARVVYADNDPIVLAHAQALLISSGQGRTAYIEADLAQPEEILKTSVLHDTLDLSQPVALSLNAVLHFVADDAEAYRIVDTFTDALAPGSALAISHATSDFSETAENVAGVYRSVGTAVGLRDRDRFARFFERWELVEPGVTLTHRWHPDAATAASGITDTESSNYAAVARKLG